MRGRLPFYTQARPPLLARANFVWSRLESHMEHTTKNKAHNSSPGTANSALQPIADSERVFGWKEQASLWFSMGVGLLVIQVGAYLVPGISTTGAMVAIVLGSIIGSALLAWTAHVGCASGLTSAGLMHRTFGSGFARVPVLLNIVQLIGWTTFELVIMRDGTLAIGRNSLGLALDGSVFTLLSTALWTGVLLLLVSGSMTRLVRKIIGRFGLPLVIASLLWLTWQFAGKIQAQGLDAFWAQKGDGSMGLLAAMDLVIGMPVSWLPLVADYARHGKDRRSAASGTFTGYAISNIWCYVLGVMVATVAPKDGDLVSWLLLAQGGLIALSLVLVDEIDNAYGDVYSGSVSAHSIVSRLSIRQWGLALTLLCMVLAMVLPMQSIEPFLLMLSSIFVPLYGVILGRTRGAAANGRAIEPVAAAIWIGGIVLFQGISNFAPEWGATLPSLAITFALAWVTRARNGS